MEGPGVPSYREKSKDEGKRGSLLGLNPDLGTRDLSSGSTTSWWNLTSSGPRFRPCAPARPDYKQHQQAQPTSLKSTTPPLALLLSSPSHSPNTSHVTSSLSPQLPLLKVPTGGPVGSSRCSDTATPPTATSRLPGAALWPTDICSAARVGTFCGGQSSAEEAPSTCSPQTG